MLRLVRSAVLRSLLCCLAGLALWPSAGFAQAAPALDVERFTPATGPDSYFGVEATRTPGPARYNLLLMTGYEAGTLMLPGSGVIQLRSRVTTWLAGEIGIGGRFAVGAALPAYPYQHFRFAPGGDDSAGFALGDGSVHARYRLIGESSSRPDAPKDGPGLALAAGAQLPTHTSQPLTGEPSARADLSLLADFQLLGAGVAANLGVRHRFDGVGIAGATSTPVRLHDEMLFGAALKIPLPPAPSVVAVLETRGATDFRSRYATQLELALGAHLLLGPFTLGAAGGLGFGSGVGTPDGRVLLGVSYAPLDSDSDRDGVDDGRDECPFLAEDHDGYRDQDGCPDPDNDNDLIPDLDDLCPLDAAEEGKDDDEDGCTDGAQPTRK